MAAAAAVIDIGADDALYVVKASCQQAVILQSILEGERI